MTDHQELVETKQRYEEALIEIRDVAAISEGVGWYAMIAQKALDDD